MARKSSGAAWGIAGAIVVGLAVAVLSQLEAISNISDKIDNINAEDLRVNQQDPWRSRETYTSPVTGETRRVMLWRDVPGPTETDTVVDSGGSQWDPSTDPGGDRTGSYSDMTDIEQTLAEQSEMETRFRGV